MEYYRIYLRIDGMDRDIGRIIELISGNWKVQIRYEWRQYIPDFIGTLTECKTYCSELGAGFLRKQKAEWV